MKKPSSSWHLVLLTIVAMLSLSAESFSMPTSASDSDQPHALVSDDDQTISLVTSPDNSHDQSGIAIVPELLWTPSSQDLELISSELPRSKKLRALNGIRWHRWLCVEHC